MMNRSAVYLTALATVLISSCLCAADNDSRPTLISPGPSISKSGDPLEDLRKSAAKGDPQAAYELAERFLRGNGAPVDVPQALRLLEQASKAGHAEALFRLGKLHEDGGAVAKDPAKAFSYYEAAARKGLATAQFNVGAMYASGRGVARNYVEGLAWLILASRNGADPSGEQQLRAHLAESPRAQLVAKAEKRAEELTRDPQSATAPAGDDLSSTDTRTFTPRDRPPAPTTQSRSRVQLPQPDGSAAPKTTPPVTTPTPALPKDIPLPASPPPTPPAAPSPSTSGR